MVALLLTLAIAQVPPGHLSGMPLSDRSRSSDGVSYSGLPNQNDSPNPDGANALGAGIGAPCGCASIRDSHGVAVSWTRSSGGYCTKTIGTYPQTYQVGDVIWCPNDAPRVEAGTDGTSISGTLTEPQVTNTVVDSECINCASWTNSASVTNPTLNGANAATFPWDAGTAEDYSFPATSGANFSERQQIGACPLNSTVAFSCYVAGVGASGTTDLCVHRFASITCEDCNFQPYPAWTRCVHRNAPVLSGGAAGRAFIGPNSQWNGGVARSAARVYVGGCQCEPNIIESSYIPTGAATASRAADVSSIPSQVGPKNYLAATVVAPPLFALNDSILQLYVDANNLLSFTYNVSSTTVANVGCKVRIGGVETNVGSANLVAGSANRVSCSHDGAQLKVCVNGACTSTPRNASLTPATGTLYVGTTAAGGAEGKTPIKRWCRSDVESRCH